jgi:hypothetical protein
MANKAKILRDHTKVGQRLVTPLNQLMGSRMTPVSWVDHILPELLWIALIQRRLGSGPGVKLITSVARAARLIHRGQEYRLFAAISNFAILSESERDQLRINLSKTGELSTINECLDHLISWYPECPLSFLFVQAFPLPTTEKLIDLKDIVASLLGDRWDREPTLVKATAVWLGFDADFITVQKDSILSQFPEVEHYPETEISRKVGAQIGAMVNMLFSAESHQYNVGSFWPDYFWNRGLKIDKCKFD